MRVALMLLIACGEPSEKGEDVIPPADTPEVDTPAEPADTAVPGETDTPDTEPPEGPLVGVAAPAAVYGIPNIDDDDGDGLPDFLSPVNAADDDLTTFTITPSANGGLGLVSLRLRLTGDVDEVRASVGGQPLVDATQPELTLPWTVDLIDVEASFRAGPAHAVLTIEELDNAGNVRSSAEVDLFSGPLLLNHHLQPAEQVWAVEVDGFFGDNRAFIQGFTDALGPLFSAVNGGRFQGDVWFQDELEWATVTGPGDRRIDVVLDSIRNRGLDGWAESNVGGSDELPLTIGRGFANSQDSFGNLEVSPPVTVNGVTWPFGRIYYGANGPRFGPVQELRDALAAQRIQAPFELDTSWLCVGHVDEFMSFIPDSAAPKGFRLVWTDVDLAWSFLESLPQDTRLPRWAPNLAGHGIGTIRELTEDRGLRAYNEDIRDNHLNPLLTQVMTELGLDEQDLLRIPGLFEAARGCGGTAAALIPGMANLVVVNPPNQPVKLLMADPFLRSDANDPSSDPMIAYMRSLFPHELVFVDDWTTYHMALGEVHCGSNVRRTPIGAWWIDGAALLGVAP